MTGVDNVVPHLGFGPANTSITLILKNVSADRLIYLLKILLVLQICRSL